jgi:hypothetical protein
MPKVRLRCHLQAKLEVAEVDSVAVGDEEVVEVEVARKSTLSKISDRCIITTLRISLTMYLMHSMFCLSLPSRQRSLVDYNANKQRGEKVFRHLCVRQRDVAVTCTSFGNQQVLFSRYHLTHLVPLSPKLRTTEQYRRHRQA